MITPERLIQKTKVFLLDLDGTLYLGETPIGRVQETLALLRAAGKKLVYCTNNSSKTPSEYVRKLEKIGLWGEGEAPGFYGQKLFCMALPGLSREGDDRWQDSAPCTVEAVEIVHM